MKFLKIIMILLLGSFSCQAKDNKVFDPDAFLANSEIKLSSKNELDDGTTTKLPPIPEGFELETKPTVTEINDKTPLKTLQSLAEAGDSTAQFALGMRYFEGRGVIKDSTVGLKWWEKATEQKDSIASFISYNIGTFYVDGYLVDKDLTIAIKWFQKSAEQGYVEAQYTLGTMYERGRGIAKDSTMAIKWYQAAAEQGNNFAKFRLGVAYSRGEGVEKDSVMAAQWYQKAAKQGVVEAQFLLSMMYDQGDGVTKNSAMAAKWVQKAAEQNYASAQKYLGYFYATGKGLIKDEMEGLAWYYVAKSNGVDDEILDKNISICERQLGRELSLLAQKRALEISEQIKSKRIQAASNKTPVAVADDNEPLGNGSGAFISTDGLILTAAHVVENTQAIKVLTERGLLPGTVVQIDTANDIAILRCKGTFTPLTVTESKSVRLGQSVSTIGFPQIMLQGFSPKFTKGEISSQAGMQDDPRHWQISVPVQPGNSGGPLLDENGNIVGIVVSGLNVLKVAKHTGNVPQNVNYAVKSAYIRPLLEEYGVTVSAPQTSTTRTEDMVERVQKSIVMILTYGNE